MIHFGGNSGYQAINLAFLLGARRILLLGFDMGYGKSGKRHFFGDHPGGMNVPSPFPDFINSFRSVAAQAPDLGLEIVNCSRETALDCFPRAPIERYFQ
jgi:hypothetical protein